MPPQRTSDRSRPRQDPVSCQLCRVKKLRCDRRRPCANCRSRHITCEYQGELYPVTSEAPSEEDELRKENSIIKARLDRLERTVYASEVIPALNFANHPSTSTTISSPPRTLINVQKGEDDSQWLEELGRPIEGVQMPLLSERLMVDVQSEDQVISSVHQSSPLISTIKVPSHALAIQYLAIYAENLDSLQHVLHVEHTQYAFDQAYAQIQAGESIDPGVLALILSVCASVSLYWATSLPQNGREVSSTILEDPVMARKISIEWLRQALLAIEKVRIGTTKTSLEAIQACIIMTFLFYHVEGFTVRVRMMHATATAIARDQGLHKLDRTAARTAELTQSAVIDREVRRKVWWHISCTDWLLTYIRGPTEGMYSIHPHQASTKHPRNLTRDDLNTQGPEFSRGLHEPTIMSYYLQRLQLANVCREISDALWMQADVDQIGSDLVRTLDAKFDTVSRNIPRFLRIDIPRQQLKSEFGQLFTYQIDRQRIMANQMLNTMRCKLHLPFLIRAKDNPVFQFSRSVGLQSARQVFKIRQLVLDEHDASDSPTFGQVGALMLHFFYATVVLVMDICVNSDGVHDPNRLAEIREALNIIEQTKEHSEMGAPLSDSLIAVLRKHQVKLPNTGLHPARGHAEDAQQPLTTNGGGHWSGAPSSQPQQPYLARSGLANGIAGTTADEASTTNDDWAMEGGLWQDFINQGQMLDTQDWEALLQDLDMRIF